MHLDASNSGNTSGSVFFGSHAQCFYLYSDIYDSIKFVNRHRFVFYSFPRYHKGNSSSKPNRLISYLLFFGCKIGCCSPSLPLPSLRHLDFSTHQRLNIFSYYSNILSHFSHTYSWPFDSHNSSYLILSWFFLSRSGLVISTRISLLHDNHQCIKSFFGSKVLALKGMVYYAVPYSAQSFYRYFYHISVL